MLTRQSHEENAERLRRLRIFAFGGAIAVNVDQRRDV